MQFCALIGRSGTCTGDVKIACTLDHARLVALRLHREQLE